MATERSRSLAAVWGLGGVVAVVAAALVPLIRSLYLPGGTELAVPWFVLVAGFALTEIVTLQLRVRGETETYSVSEIVLVLALFSASPTVVIASVFVGLLLALGFRRIPPVKFFFNLAQYMLHTEIALLVFHSLAGSTNPLSIRTWFAALAATLSALLVQVVLISWAVTIVNGRTSIKEFLRGLAWSVMCTSVNTTLGLVVVIVCSESVAAALLLVGPVAVVFAAYRAYLSEHNKSEGLQFLYRASEALSAEQDFESGLVALLEFARETFHVELAEVVLHGEKDEAIGYRSCAGPGETKFRLEPCGIDQVSAVVGLVGENEGVVLHRPEGGSHFANRDGAELSSVMVATFSDESGVRGAALIAHRRGSLIDRFTKDEVSLFETFVNHLGTTLEKSRLSTSLAQLRALKQELAHQAYHDSLTGLANRLMFRDLVDSALADAARDDNKVSVLFIDLDDFKTVNDTMGHAAGDALLEEVANRISSSVGEFGTAARLGGDEFAVLLPVVGNDSEVRAVADRILVALGDPVSVDGQSVVAQASIGIASHVGAADAAQLMQHADVAMYTAKRNGKGRFDEFDPTMSLTVARRHQLKVGLERAIADEEFTLHYQPVICAGTASISGVEALLRWKDPDKGLMPPSEFVGVAEETGMIVPIGRIVLREACRQAAEWAPLLPDLRMFVNLSTRQLADPDIVEDVCNALEDAGLSAQQIVLEVTETAMMRDIDEAKATLRALKQLGVSIAIDDFGTGYSSLSYLRELPIDVLKIAKSIIDAMCESQQDAAFVKGIIELGHVVGLTVVAEGVEHLEQYAHLVDMGCDFIQGYYYAPSMEPAEITDVLNAHAATPDDQVALNAAS